MSKMVRRNASDKLKLIKMVHNNPILWDSRLPNFKGADEEKSRAWQMIGNEFNAPGRRVARAFKSLRESYRRELSLVKSMGEGFKSKWGLYSAMDFLRGVIRERKNASTTEPSTSNQNKTAPRKTNQTKHKTPASSMSSAVDDYSFYVKTELDLDQSTDNHITSTLPNGFDDMEDETSDDSNQVDHPQHPQNHVTNSTAVENTEVEELEAIDDDFPYPFVVGNNMKRKRSSMEDDGYEQSLRLQPTVREILNSKFCGFITAKLNSMDDTEADNLMNRILMLLVQTQNNVGEVPKQA